MFETLTTEVILSSGIAGVSALALIGSLVLLRAPRQKKSEVDIDEIVRNAPYHRLYKVLPVKGS
jgi:hypothetical protein